MKKILFVAHSGSQGGAELSLQTIFDELDRSKYEATAVFAWDGPMVEAARRRGVRAEILPLSWWMCFEPSPWYFKNLLLGSVPRIWQLTRTIRQNRIDLVYTNTAVVFDGAVAAWLAGVPHVWHVREVLKPSYMKPRILPLRLIARLIGRLSNRVVFASHSNLKASGRGIPEEKRAMVYNSVSIPGNDPPDRPNEILDRLGLGSDLRQCVVLWIGRFSERKNPLLLIRAVARMKHAEKAAVVFVGEGPLEQAMTGAIESLDLGDTCRIIGFQKELRPLFQLADLLVLSSREEAFGRVLIEAGAYGKPVVSTRTEGPVEIVVDGQTGFLVDKHSENQLAEKIDRLVADPRKRTEMGRAGAMRVAELFSAKKNTRKIEGILDGILNRAK